MSRFSCRPLALEALETRVLLAGPGVAGDPGSIVSWESAVVADQGVTIYLETTAADHTLVLRGNGDASTMVTLNTDQLAANVDRITVEGVNWVRLTGTHSFETVELNNIRYADLGMTAISLVLYAAGVDRLRVNATELTAVITGPGTLLQSEHFNHALLLTDAADLRLSSSNPFIESLSIVNLDPQNSVALDFSVGKLSLVNFTAPVRLLPFDSALIYSPPAPILPVTTVSAVAATPTALPPDATATLPLSGLDASPMASGTVLPPPVISPSDLLSLQSITLPTIFDAAPNLPGDKSLPVLRPVEITSVAFSPTVNSTGGTGEITAKVDEVFTGLPTDLSAHLPEKLAALPPPVTPGFSSELKHLITQALIAAQTTSPRLVEAKPLLEGPAPVTPDAGGENRVEHHPVEEVNPKRARVEKNAPLLSLAASTWERTKPASHPGELSPGSEGGKSGEAKTGVLAGTVAPATLEAFAFDQGERVVALRHSNPGRVVGSHPTESDGQMLLFTLPSALQRDSRGEGGARPSVVSAEKMGGWINALADVGSKLATDWSEWLWPYSRPVQVSEIKAYLVEQLLAEITPGERSLLLLDPARLRPAAPFGLV